MTTPAHADTTRVRQLLATGKTVQQVADLTTWPRQRVVAVINGTKGWLHDSDKDVAYQPDRPGMAPQLPDGTPPTVPDPGPEPAPNAETKPARLADAPVGQLLAGAVDIDDKTVQTQLRKTTEHIARLRQVVTGVEERTAAAREVAELERRLAEARARLKTAGGRRITAGPASGTGPTAKEIRAWAKDNGIACNAKGHIPAHVREQYDAAHGGGQ
jgi:hypothetical protein